MTEFVAPASTWLVTYLLHSTFLYGAVWLIDALEVLRRPAAREPLWRAALIGAIVTATVQSAGFVERAPLVAPRIAATYVAPAEPRSVPTVAAPGDAANSVISTPVRRTALDDLRFEFLAHWTAWLALLWLAGATFGVLRLLALGWLARREIADRVPAAAAFAREFTTLCAAHGVRPPVVSVAPALAGPISLASREVVVPPWVIATLDARQRRAMLAHELAHQMRRDPQWLLLALGLGALLWLQPLHGLARRRLAHLAELEADAWAARAVNDPRALAECLAECAEYFDVNRAALFGAAMATESTLVTRVDRLLKGMPMQVEKLTWPLRAGVVVALLAAAVVLPGCNFKNLRHGGRHSTSIAVADDGDFRVSVDRSGYSLRLDTDGPVTFTDDESDLATLAPGCVFELSEHLDGMKRGYTVTADRSGALTRVFSREDQVVPRDATAAQWLAGALPRMFRESGFDAEARVARLLARGGPALVLTEVDLAGADYAKASYLGLLLGTAKLDSVELEGALASAAGIGSDYELRRALDVAMQTQSIDGPRYTRLLKAASQISADFELAELLTTAVSQMPADAAARAAWLAVARQLDSDFELRRVIEAGLARCGNDADFAVTLVNLAAERLDSDFELRTVLEKVAGGATNPALASAYLAAATTLDSDFEKRTALEALAGSVAGDPALHRRYREVAREMGDFERGAALRALDDATGL